jgi:hypothetical protein
MSLLNSDSDGLHSVLIAIHKVIVDEGPIEREKLIALCAPKTIVIRSKNEKGEDKESEIIVNKTLIRWEQFGLFQKLNNEVFLHSDIPKSDRTLDRLSFVARKRLLAPENNERFWEAKDSGSADFTRALSWCLAQDVYEFECSSWRDAEYKINAQSIIDPNLIVQNDTRWRCLRSWIPFLGFGYINKNNRLVIDPTTAVRDALPEVFGQNSTLKVQDFVIRLSEVLPVVDGGEYRLKVEQKLRQTEGPHSWRPPPTGQLSTSLSRVVMFLIATGDLQATAASDDRNKRVILTGRNRRTLENYSEISWTKKQ